MRPRPDDRHIATQHIEKLRQFIQRCSPQKSAHVGDPRIVPRGLPKPALVRCMMVHRAEFQHPEAGIGEADAALAEQDRAGAFQADRHAIGGQGRQHDQISRANTMSVSRFAAARQPLIGQSGGWT